MPRGVQELAWIASESTIFTSGAVQELSGELLVAGEVLWEAFWLHGWHSGELFLLPGSFLVSREIFLGWI